MFLQILRSKHNNNYFHIKNLFQTHQYLLAMHSQSEENNMYRFISHNSHNFIYLLFCAFLAHFKLNFKQFVFFAFYILH